MVNGGWWMADGGWWMVDGEWWMVDGGWWMVDGGLFYIEKQCLSTRLLLVYTATNVTWYLSAHIHGVLSYKTATFVNLDSLS